MHVSCVLLERLSVVKGRRSISERCSTTYNFSKEALRHLYSSGGEVRFEKLRNTELHERGERSKGIITGISASQLRRLQSVFNSAARLIHRSSRYEHVTPMLQELHWLRSPERIDFKLAVHVYGSLVWCHGIFPTTSSASLIPTTTVFDRRHPHS